MTGTPAAAVRFLALGDSYTIGEAVPENDRWPVQLAELLRARGVPVAPPEIVARTGWTTDELAAGIDAAQLTGPYDLVTLLAGVNDQYRGRPLDEYEQQFGALLARAVGFAGNRADHVLVLSIPDWGVTPFAQGRDRTRIAREIDAFNDANRRAAVQTGARYVDVAPASRRAASEPALVASDGLHLSGAMYAEWARLALPEALQALGATSTPAPPNAGQRTVR